MNAVVHYPDVDGAVSATRRRTWVTNYSIADSLSITFRDFWIVIN